MRDGDEERAAGPRRARPDGPGRPDVPGGQDGPDAADFPARRAPACATLGALDASVSGCRACPRLVAWREEVAAAAPAHHRGEEYWARPVPGFGPPDAALAVVGLAPAAHGGNRTGRMFTGDASGDLLFDALHTVGLASQPTSTHPGDGLELYGVRITSPVHCAPPDNRPTTGERDTCRPWLATELELLRPTLRAVVVLGGFGWQALLPVLSAAGWALPRPRPAFRHGGHTVLTGGPAGPDLHLLGCYHPSRRNVNTGRVTFAMLTEVLAEGALRAELPTTAG